MARLGRQSVRSSRIHRIMRRSYDIVALTSNALPMNSYSVQTGEIASPVGDDFEDDDANVHVQACCLFANWECLDVRRPARVIRQIGQQQAVRIGFDQIVALHNAPLQISTIFFNAALKVPTTSISLGAVDVSNATSFAACSIVTSEILTRRLRTTPS